MSKKNETKVAPWVHSIAGGCGGALGAILTNPLEVVKTRLQSSSSSTVKTVSGKFVPRDHLLRNLQIIFKSEGFKALFKEPGLINGQDGGTVRRALNNN